MADKKKDPLDGNDGETRVEQMYLAGGCRLVYKVKKGVWYNQYSHRWMNFGGDIFTCIDVFAISEGTPAYPRGIYLDQSTSYKHSADHKEKIDKAIPVDISDLAHIRVTSFYKISMGKSTKILMHIEERREPGNWFVVLDEMKGMFTSIIVGATYAGNDAYARTVLAIRAGDYVEYHIETPKSRLNRRTCTVASFRKWMAKNNAKVRKDV